MIDFVMIFKNSRSFSLFIHTVTWLNNGTDMLALIRGLYCSRFERCGDESVAVSLSSFRTPKTVLMLTPVA